MEDKQNLEEEQPESQETEQVDQSKEEETEESVQPEEKKESQEEASLATSATDQSTGSLAGVKKKAQTIDVPVTLTSKKKWFWASVIIAILNPIFSGLILGVFFLNEKELKKEGKIILVLAIVFGFIHGYLQLKLMPWMIQQGLI